MAKLSLTKRTGIYVIISLFIVAITACQQQSTEKDSASIYLTVSNDSSIAAIISGDTVHVEKIVVSSSEQDHQLITHLSKFWRGPKIDFNEIADQIQFHREHAFMIALFWISVCFIAFLFILFLWKRLFALASERQRQTIRYRNYGLQVAAYITLISGCIIYYVGFLKTGTASSFIAYFVRPFIASLGMFIGNTSYQEVCEECTNSPLYMTLFGIIHMSAITISAIVVISFFWKRLSSMFIRFWWKVQACILKDKKTVNIFFGSSEPSLILAKEIKSKDEHVVFVDTPSNDSNKNQQMSLSQIFGLFPYDRELMRQLKGWHCIVMNTTYDIAKDDHNNEYVLDKLGIGRLRDIINHSKRVRIFFLSDSPQDNVKSIINIQEDYLFKNPCCPIDIYGLAPRDNHNIAMERKHKEEKDYAVKPAVHIIDSAYLAIQWLKTKPEYHPVQFVTQSEEEQKQGVVNDKFNALVIGFGETGQEALAFLYEFGAFVNDSHVRSPFHCFIADPKAIPLKDEYYMKRPALITKKEIEFWDVSDEDEGYWSKIEAYIKDLQYVVVSTGNDERNMTIAVNLYQLAIRCRDNNLTRFKIFVRSYSQKNESWMERIASYYNLNNQNSQGEIVVFGKMTDIYQYDNIIIDYVLREAEVYGNTYYETYKKLEEIVGKEEVSLSGLAKIRKKHRTLSQDIANSLHAKTKFLLMGLNEKKIKKLFTDPMLSEKEEEIKNCLIKISKFSEEHNFVFEKDLSKMKKGNIELLMYNMAVCEHLRWNAAHEIMGYKYGEEKNEIIKQHDCLRDFSELPKFTHNPKYDKGEYDFLVLETSIKLEMKKYLESQETRND